MAATIKEKLSVILAAKEAIRDKFSLSNELPFLQYAKNISGESMESLLFKIPQIQNNIVLYFKIQFSKTDDFTSIEKTINTAQAYGLEITQTEGVTIKNTIVIDNVTKTINDIRIFTIQGTVGFPIHGLSDIFSGEQLTLNIKNIDKDLKYYRFQWSNDNGETFGKFGYGQTNGYINVFDDSCDVVKEYVDELVGNINEILDNINGQII